MILTVAALIALSMLVILGNNWLKSTTIDVESAHLPESFSGYRIAQISDLHGHRFGLNQSRLLKRVREARPDLIAVTGDLANHGTWNAERVENLARRLRDIAPVYFITGNHEQYARDLPELLDLLERAGVRVLAGTSISMNRGSDSITLAGIDDPRHYRQNEGQYKATVRWKAALAVLRTAIEPGKFSLLLSHRPEVLAEYAELGFDLVLSGHAHGGQIRLPIIGPLYAPNQGRFPRYTSGMYRRGETALVVSRGLGNSGFPIRIFNRPEIVIVELQRAFD